MRIVAGGGKIVAAERERSARSETLARLLSRAGMRHNVLNATAALTLAERLGAAPATLAAALLHLPVETIHANPRQPRKRFDEDALQALAESPADDWAIKTSRRGSSPAAPAWRRSSWPTPSAGRSPPVFRPSRASAPSSAARWATTP